MTETATRRELVHAYSPRGSARLVLEARDPEVLMSGPAGTGKAQPLDATVWTPAGARRMGDLEIGDEVLTPFGGRAKVIDVPFEDNAPVWRVIFRDGAQVECSDGHLWRVGWRGSDGRSRSGVLPLAEMLPNIRHRNGARATYWVETSEPVDFDAQQIPIPPYVLGVLLGDSYIRAGETSFTSADSEIAERVALELGPAYKLNRSSKPGNLATAYRIVRNGWRANRGRNPKPGYVSRTISGKWMARLRVPGPPVTAIYIGSFGTPEEAEAALAERADETRGSGDEPKLSIAHHLADLGLAESRSASKFVPDVYKLNSPDVRWAILQGLMDTDGYAGRTDISFTSTSRRLAEDVAWLVESLGGTARITSKQPSSGQVAHTVWPRIADPARLFHLGRKRERAARATVPRRWIERVEFVGTKRCRCIAVDTWDGLYLTERFVPTHNSRACLEKLLLQALKYPGMRGVIIRKTQVSLTSTALKTWREHVAKEALANRTVWFYGGSAEEPPQYRFANGSTILLGGMDKPTKIMSAEYDVAYVQEATELTVTDWEAISTRMRNGVLPYQQIIADCNPDVPTHWLKVRADRTATRMIDCRHEDNPVLFDEPEPGTFILTRAGEAYMSRLDALTGVRYLRLRKGLWVAAEGVIYEDFSPDLHIIDQMPKGWEHWARYWAVDFGFTNPTVIQCWAMDPDGRLYLYREWYRTRRTVDEHARDVLSVVAPGGTWREPRPHLIVCDHDAENRARFEAELGLGTTNADKNVKDGIETVERRLRVAEDGRPRLFFLRTALAHRDGDLEEARKPCSTLEEIPGYVWAPSPDGKPTKDEPLKINDHGMDAMRYLCKELDPLARPSVRVLRW